MPFPTFKNQQLLDMALTHRSALNEATSPSSESNERLEFLGDAVLELITTIYLYNEFPQEQEGLLSAVRSTLVKSTTLAEVARVLDLGKKLYMSAGEEAHGGRENESLLADAVEAIIGGLYLDQGEAAVSEFLHAELFPKLSEIMDRQLYTNPKGRLQEYVQKKGMGSPEYVVVEEEGPEHSRTFTVQVVIKDQVYGKGTGKSKQLAEKDTAQWVLDHLEELKL